MQALRKKFDAKVEENTHADTHNLHRKLNTGKYQIKKCKNEFEKPDKFHVDLKISNITLNITHYYTGHKTSNNKN